MTERARMWRAVDVLALAGLLVLLVGLPVSGSVDGNGTPYARAASFEVPWPRVGDHIVYDLIVDDENGVRNYPSIMEVQRRLATPGEVPVDAPYVEERSFRPVYAKQGHFLLDSRGWMDRTYYLETGERAYVVAEGIHPTFENLTGYADPERWVSAAWEGQAGTRYSNTDHWTGFGQRIRHIPDDESAVALFTKDALGITHEPDHVPTIAEATYRDQHLFGSGFGSEQLALDRALDQVFPDEFDGDCVLHRIADSYQPFGRLPLVMYWDAGSAGCLATTGAWYDPHHPGMAGMHEELRWADGSRVTLDLVPRMLARGTGAEYRPSPGWNWVLDPDVARPERSAVSASKVPLLSVDDDARPIVRNLSLALLRSTLVATGAECVQEFLKDDGRIVSFAWRLWNDEVLAGAPVQRPVDIPVLPTGHAPADAATAYEMQWSLGLMSGDGQAMVASVLLRERYPGPQVEFIEWDTYEGDVCVEAGTALDAHQTVVSPVLLSADAERQVVRHLDLTPGERDTALSTFSFQPAFDWADPEGARWPLPLPDMAPRTAILPSPLDRSVPAYDPDIGVAAYAHLAVSQRTPHTPIAGALSAHDGANVHMTRWGAAASPGSTDAQPSVASEQVTYLLPAPDSRGAGLLLLMTWAVLRLAGAIRVGAHFPAVAWLYAKIQNADVLVHERRAAIMGLLRADPGLTATDVAKRLGLGWGATVHHLDRLKQAGLVHSVRDGRRRRFVVTEDGVPTAEALARAPERARLVAAVTREPGLTAGELAKRLERDRSSVARLAARLVEANVVERRRDGRKVRFFPASDSAEA